MIPLTITDGPSTITFGDLEVGDIFTFSEGGLFIKVKVAGDSFYNTVVVVPSGPSHKGYVKAGSETVWPCSGEVFPIVSIIATRRK